MKAQRGIAFVLLASGASVAVLALGVVDPPDSEVNPLTGEIETLDPVAQGSQNDVRYVIEGGTGGSPTIEIVTDNVLSDRDPRLTIAPDGDAWVVWWRDDATDRVLFRKRDYATGTWGAERLVSRTAESSRHPVIVHDGTNAWVAYEYADQGQTCVAVRITIDDPEPITDRIPLGWTDFSGDRDVLIHAEAGQVWVTWVDSAAEVGWSERDPLSGTWSAPGYESYLADTVRDARSRIRAAVLAH